MPQSVIPYFQKNLLSWYEKNARDLPWRRAKDPYAVWVSEIMLQQTQVKTVIPYYEKWLRTFPTIRHLAEAPLENVLKRWAGLGYYRRARMLHQAAQELVAGFGGNLPSSVPELLKIKGIGRYTAGAIASIAFDRKAPILDGNVIRILTRIFAIPSDIAEISTLKKLWDLAEEVLPEKNTGDFNQAMMELGATVCFPDNPQCGVCPAAKICKAHALGKETFYPVRKNREKIEKIKTAALILKRNGKILIQKQAEKERWGGLWMFPHWQDKKTMLKETGLSLKDLARKTTVKHGFTKYQIQLEVFESRKKGLELKSRRNLKWVHLKNLSDYAFPSPHKKIAAEIL